MLRIGAAACAPVRTAHNAVLKRLALYGVNVRFGSKADMCAAKCHVRFTPNSDRKSEIPQKAMSALPPESRHVQCTSPCPLWANSGHNETLFDHFISALLKLQRHFDADRFGSLEVDYELELAGL